jgi:hypothetical protein
MICKYVGLLEDAITTKLDNVFSADHFTKDFINANSLSSNSQHSQELMRNINQLKTKYNLEDRYEKWGYNASKYGEQFVYIVPYDRALNKLLRQKNNGSLQESYTINESTFIDKTSGKSQFAGSIELTVNKGFVLDQFIKEEHLVRTVQETIHEQSMIYEFNESAKDTKGEFTKTIPDDYKFDIPSSGDGTIDLNKSNTTKDSNLNVSGAIIKDLERHKVFPKHIGDKCIGYVYLESDVETELTSSRYSMMSNYSLAGNISKYNKNDSNNGFDNTLKNIAKELADKIDSSFINANVDLKDEIYMVLKQNNLNENSKARLNITFIPPEDMLHIYYKMDEKTHRGISDLENSLIPAILYASIYLSTTLGNMTRGQDKRVYYVKQNVETNVAKTMLNVVNQIKKSNFNLRSLNSMYNVLDIVGKYNDYIIPLSKAGDPPVQFEVMQGQQIELKQDIIDLLETLMLNPTDVTKEIIQARNSMDYAIQATMSNTKFLRKILKRQQKTMPFLSRATSMIYNYEYSTNEIIDITLPAPEILNLTNTNQMIDANNTQIQTIIDTEMTEASEEEKNIFKRKMIRWNLNSHLPYEIIDKFMREAKVEAALLTQDSDSE